MSDPAVLNDEINRLQEENTALYNELTQYRALILVNKHYFSKIIGTTTELCSDKDHNYIAYYGPTSTVSNITAKLQICIKPIKDGYVKHQIYFDGIKLHTLYKNDSLTYTKLNTEGEIAFKCNNCEYDGDYEEDKDDPVKIMKAYSWIPCNKCNYSAYVLYFHGDNPIANAVRSYCNYVYDFTSVNNVPNFDDDKYNVSNIKYYSQLCMHNDGDNSLLYSDGIPIFMFSRRHYNYYNPNETQLTKYNPQKIAIVEKYIGKHIQFNNGFITFYSGGGKLKINLHKHQSLLSCYLNTKSWYNAYIPNNIKKFYENLNNYDGDDEAIYNMI